MVGELVSFAEMSFLKFYFLNIKNNFNLKYIIIINSNKLF